MRLWIARDLDSDISLYYEKPKLDKLGEFWGGAPFGMRLSNDSFPEVTFENSPQEVEIKLVNNIANGFAEDLLTNCKPLEGELSKFVDDNFDNLIYL